MHSSCTVYVTLFINRLKERFELRREHYKRFFQEQADELERVEKENEERRNRIKEEKHEQEMGEKKSSLTSGLHYSYYAPISSPSLHEVRTNVPVYQCTYTSVLYLIHIHVLMLRRKFELIPIKIGFFMNF